MTWISYLLYFLDILFASPFSVIISRDKIEGGKGFGVSPRVTTSIADGVNGSVMT